MSQKSALTWFLVTSFAIASCGDDTNLDPSSDMDTDPSQTGSTNHDGGSKDAGVRTTSRDASSSHVVDASGDPGTDPTPVDPPVIDAGHRDAGSNPTKADAGKTNPTPADAGSTGGSTCDTLTYDSFGKAFLSNYCVSCHGGFIVQKGVKLDTLAGVQASKSKLKSQVLGALPAMPPLGSPAPTAAERTQFGQWIDCGPK